MTKIHPRFLIVCCVLLLTACSDKPEPAIPASQPRPTLTVNSVQPQQHEIASILAANGSIRAWQEAVIGAEISGLRLHEIKVQVGEIVAKGQLLATFDEATVLADIAQSRALLAEAQATLAEAQLNGDRARRITASGALSAQQIAQYLTSEKTAQARMESAKAQLDVQLLKQKHTKVLASDDGVISSRSATLGAVATPGQELFKLIRQQRLEWHGEVTATEITQLKTGMPVTVSIANIGDIAGTISFIAPTLDPQTRNGLVYVDLPNAASQGFKAGMFAQGKFQLGKRMGISIPQQALSMREGFSYVFKLSAMNGDQAQVSQQKVQTGQRDGDNIEIVSGVNLGDTLVASGAAFLVDGDNVKVVQP